MRKSETRTIDGVTYTCRQMDAIRGITMFRKLLLLLGHDGVKIWAMGEEGIAEFAAQLKDDDGVSVPIEDARAIHRRQRIQIMEARADARDADGRPLFTPETFRELLADTTADKVDIGADVAVSGSVAEHFSDHFAGRPDHMMDVLAFVLEVNFKRPT